MRAQLERSGTPRPKVIGIDEISVRKGHDYRIVVSDLQKHRPICFGGTDRSEASMDEFYRFLGDTPVRRVRLAVMDMWNYAESIVMRSWRRCPCARSGNGAIVTAHNVTGGRRTMTSAWPAVCPGRGIGLA